MNLLYLFTWINKKNEVNPVFQSVLVVFLDYSKLYALSNLLNPVIFGIPSFVWVLNYVTRMYGRPNFIA